MLNAEEKLRIGREATREVPVHGSVIIDSGSTGQRLAEVFPVDRDVHVITNSLTIAATLGRRGVKTLDRLGGQVRTNTFAMVDASTVATVSAAERRRRCSSAATGCRSHAGLTTPYRPRRRSSGR